MGLYRGGGELYDLNAAKALQEAGVTVRFLVGKPWLSPPPHPVDQFPVTYCATPYLRGLANRLPRGGGRLMHWDLDLFCARARALLSESRGEDIVQVSGLSRMALLKGLRNVPLVIRYAGPPSPRDEKDLSAFDAVVANGDAHRYIREKLRPDADDIPPGVDLQTFHRDPAAADALRVRLGLTGRRVVLFVGRFVPLKDIPATLRIFSRAAARHPDATLLLVGEGPLEPEIRRTVSALGLDERIRFAGAVPQADLPAYYSLADIFLLLSSYDNFPNAVLEAMACGVPVLATRVGGIPLQVTDGEQGRLVPHGDESAAADALDRLLVHSTEANDMGRRGRARVEESFDWRKTAQALLRVYERVLSRAGAA